MFWVKRSLGTCCRSVSHEGQGVWVLLCAVTAGADPGALVRMGSHRQDRRVQTLGGLSPKELRSVLLL